MPQNPQKNHVYLLSDDVQVAPAAQDATAPRTFRGIANSGKPFYNWGRLSVVDLDGIEYKDKMPLLHLHDRAQRAGFGSVNVENNALTTSGTLLSNQYGSEIAADADQGFPWQMSAHVEGTHTDELAHGETAVVNGQTVTGPIDILRGVRVIEISFTPTGKDSETSALVMSDEPVSQPQTPQTTEDASMTLDEALEKIAELEAQVKTLQDENTELKNKAKQSDVDAQLSQAGFKRTDDGAGWNGVSQNTVNMLLSADAADAKAMIADLAAAQPKGSEDDKPVPEFLLGEQHRSNSAGAKPKGALSAAVAAMSQG